MKKAYIAGKITCDDDYKAKFNAAEKVLTDSGYLVMNPAILPLGFSHGDYLHICLAMVDIVDVVFLLPDWIYSEGAKIEKDHAERYGKKVKYYDAKPD